MDKCYTLGPLSYTSEWYECRTLDANRNPPFVLGASDAGVICGVSRWKSTLELYYEVCGLRAPREESEAMTWGKLLEPAIIARYQSLYGVRLRTPGHLYLSKRVPYLGATLDAEGEDSDGPFCVEAKCSTSRMYDPAACKERDCFGEGPDDVPNDYLLQAQQQMLVTGYQRCDIAVLFDGNLLRVYPQRENPLVQRALLRSAEKFYQAVLNGTPPDPDWQHDTTLPLLKQVAATAPGTRMVFGPEGSKWFAQWLHSKEAIKEQETLRDQALAHLLYELGDCEIGEDPESLYELRQTRIADAYWTEEDIAKAQRLLGTVKRQGYPRYTERKKT